MATRKTKAMQAQQALPAEDAVAASALPAEDTAATQAPEPADAILSQVQQDAATEPAPQPRREAAPTVVAAPVAEPELPFFGPALAAGRDLWQQLLDRQLEGFEAAVTQIVRISELGQQQLERAQRSLDETSRLATDALGWLAELNASNARRAVALARSAAAFFPHRAT